jgi:hypothetical protein
MRSLFLLFLVPAFFCASQIREIALPYPDSTRFRVFFTDIMHGWVVSENGSMIRTTDGGQTWMPLINPLPDSKISEAQFLPGGYGFVCLTSYNSYRTILMHTYDGGLSWTKVQFPDSTVVLRNGLQDFLPYQIFALSIDHIIFRGMRYWQSNPQQIYDKCTLASTTDGGLTWNSRLLEGIDPGAFGAGGFCPIDSSRWLLLAFGLDIPYMPPPVSCLYFSSDQGYAWNLTDYWTYTPAINMEFSDTRRGIIFIGSFNPPDYSYEPGFLVTLDSGRTWNKWLGNFREGFTGRMLNDSTIYYISFKYFETSGILCRLTSSVINPFLLSCSSLLNNHRFRYLHTCGSSVYALSIDGRLFCINDNLLSYEKIVNNSDASISFETFPNPSRNHINIVFNDPCRSVRLLSVYSILGVRAFGPVVLDQQSSVFSFPAHDIPSGRYIVHIASGSSSYTRLITIFH